MEGGHVTGKFSKVILLALLALGLAIAAGCGGSDDETAAPPAEAPAEEPPAEPPAETGAPAEEPASGSPSGDPILIGLSTAQTGILAPYDLQASQLFEMRIKQINDAGGVLGRPIETQWIDTKSDQPQAATNAEELIGNGAVV